MSVTTVEAPTYPQYHISTRWSEDGTQDAERPNRHKRLPEGRIWNGSSLNRMYREEKPEAEIGAWLRDEWWPRMVEEKLAGKNPEPPTIEITFVGREAWCLTWFSHWTFDVGQSDAEALASFESYVRRHEWYQDQLSYDGLQDMLADHGIGRSICLMGADDRWRWKGEDGSDPPCRCEHCQKHGVIRIDH